MGTFPEVAVGCFTDDPVVVEKGAVYLQGYIYDCLLPASTSAFQACLLPVAILSSLLSIISVGNLSKNSAGLSCLDHVSGYTLSYGCHDLDRVIVFSFHLCVCLPLDGEASEVYSFNSCFLKARGDIPVFCLKRRAK